MTSHTITGGLFGVLRLLLATMQV